ncbi:MAG: hypothetical protein IJ560_01420 [Alphaproteobacteria bacterium]|nr:hypothetical protein [Alphaproteobacteria bacterium]
MQLTGPEIKKRMQESNKSEPDIVITPFDDRCLGSNSYDLHLAPILKVYKKTIPTGMKPAIANAENLTMRDWFVSPWDYEDYTLRPEKYDVRNPRYALDPCDEVTHETIDIEIPDGGLILSPTIGYLGSTVEYTETRNLFPYIDGKSSLGRNFILNHHTAGRGDDGFCGQWTLEIKTLYPTVVYPYMRIGQIYYETFVGTRKPYDKNPASHYNNQSGPVPARPITIDGFIRELVARGK